MNAVFFLFAALLRLVFGYDARADYMVRELAGELTPAEKAVERREDIENHKRRTSTWRGGGD